MSWDPIKPKLLSGIGLTLLGWCLVGFQTAFIKFLHQSVPVFQVLLFQLLIMFFITFFFLAPKGIKEILPKKPLLLISRSLVAILGYFAYILAGIYGSIFDAALLVNTEGLFVPLILLLVFKKKISRKVWIGLFIGFLGVILINPPDKLFFSWATLLGLFAGLATAVVILLTSKLIKEDNSIKQVLYYGFFGAVISACFSLHNWVWPSLFAWIIIVAEGVTFTFALYFLIRAFKYASPQILGGWSYSLVVFSGLAEWVIWKKIPSVYSFIGFCLVMVGGLIILKSHKASTKF